MAVRIAILIFSFSLLYLGLISKVYDLQISKGDYYTAKAASIFSSSGALDPLRGNINFTDKNGNRIPVAIKKEYPTIFADNRAVDDQKETVNLLREIIKSPEIDIEGIFSKTNDPYELILRKAGKEEVAAVKAADIPGVGIKNESLRFYPLNDIGAHLLGFLSLDKSDLDGVYGAELYYNSSLKGEPGAVEGDRVKLPVHGQDLNLTIDRNIQSQAEEVMKGLISEFKPTGGTVMVQDPKTGAILAMASYPNFDPNDYGKYSIKNFLNPAVQSVYEPGSVMKVITMAAGIDSGKITPETTFYDSGKLVLNGRTIRNWDLKSYGTVTMTNVIEKSLNTGAAFAERTMGHKIFFKYLSDFGLTEKTGIDLPGEVVGSLGTLVKSPQDINYATASFGQGISVTPIRLLSAVSAIANHGVMMKPYINSALEPAEAGKIISPETSRKTVAMMVSAVDKAEVAKINGYSVAGKTGTAQIPDFKRGGYSEDFIHTYVGFAPAYDPKFVVLIKLDRPYGAPLAGRTVVPAFRSLAEFIINYYNIPPDNVKKLK